jgi:hypothetical protein
MKAPEKIYLHPDIGDKEFIRPWLKRPFNENSVEYTRPDAFIERAARYLNCRLYNRVEVVNFGTTLESIITKGEFVDEFRKYMKGE